MDKLALFLTHSFHNYYIVHVSDLELDVLQLCVKYLKLEWRLVYILSLIHI